MGGQGGIFSQNGDTINSIICWKKQTKFKTAKNRVSNFTPRFPFNYALWLELAPSYFLFDFKYMGATREIVEAHRE